MGSTAISRSQKLERVMGIEPTWPAWKAGALPLSYTRNGADNIDNTCHVNRVQGSVPIIYNPRTSALAWRMARKLRVE